jgi:hypothetical protein
MSDRSTTPAPPRFVTDREDEEFTLALDEAPPEALKGFLKDLLYLSSRRRKPSDGDAG